jgi:hypothetical protein
MAVGDPSVNERCRESIGVELRIRPRARDRAHIDEQIHGHLPEQSDELGDCARRMAYREERRHRLGLSHRFCDHLHQVHPRSGEGVAALRDSAAAVDLAGLKPRRRKIKVAVRRSRS